MDNRVFSEPVSIVVGLSFPTQIESVASAYTFLGEWPRDKRDTAYMRALNACRAAFRGEIDADTARIPFLAFARKHGLLLPESEPLIAARPNQMFSRSVLPSG